MSIDGVSQKDGAQDSEEKNKVLDEFSSKLFYTLDMLDLLPKWWGDKPHSYEKWARELIAPLKRKSLTFNEVLKNWQGRVSRVGLHPSTDSKEKINLSEAERQKRIDQIEQFATWCNEHSEIIRANAHHLLTSLLARAFAYVYTVRTLGDFYTDCHRGEEEAFNREVIEKRFVEDVQERYRELEEQGRITESLRDMAMNHLIKHKSLYKSKAMKVMNGGEA